MVHLTIRQVDTARGKYSVTWNNFSNNVGAPVGGGTVVGADYAAGDLVSFGLPQALVQQWITQPASNHGLILQPGNGRELGPVGRRPAGPGRAGAPPPRGLTQPGGKIGPHARRPPECPARPA